MPRKVEQNIEVRNRVRQSMVLPVPVLPPLDATEIGDTSEDTLAKFRLAKLIPSARGAAEAQSAATRRQALEPEQPLTAIQQITNPGAGTTIVIVARLPGPAVLQKIFLTMTARETAAGGNATHNVDFRVGPAIAPAGFNLTAAEYAALTPLTLPQANGGLGQIEARLVHGSQVTYEVPLENLIPFPDWIVAARVLVATLTLTTSHTYVIAASVRAQGTVQRQLLSFPFGRSSINLSTAGATRRSASPPPPRAAQISVTQGGRVLTTRTVAWEALAPNLRADWFNRQVGGAADPNISWIP